MGTNIKIMLQTLNTEAKPSVAPLAIEHKNEKDLRKKIKMKNVEKITGNKSSEAF